jgi:hypothetical protein
MSVITWSFSPREASLIHPLRVRPPTRHLDLSLDGIRLREQGLDLGDDAALCGAGRHATAGRPQADAWLPAPQARFQPLAHKT